MRTRNSMLLAAAALALGLSAVSAQAETVVRYGISMADIPLTTGQPDRGAGAYQFSAYTIYDPLVAWEMDVADRPGKLVPGLATEWKVDDATLVWVVHDTNPHALSPKVKKFVQAQHWFQDLTQIGLE